MRGRQGEDSGKGVSAPGVALAASAVALGRGCWWHGGVLEGSAAVALVGGTAALAGLALDGPLLLLAFCGTLLVYHLDRTPALSPEDETHHPARWRWRTRHGGLAALLAGGATAGACWAVPHLRPRTLAAGTALAVPAAAYALPVLGRRVEGAGHAARRLKDIGAAKPFAVAAAWAAAAAWLPALEAPGTSFAALAPTLALLAGYRFLFVLPNVLLADAADRPGDAQAGRRTAATRIWSPGGLRWLTAGASGAAVGGGALALLAFGASPLLAVDLAGPALMLVLAALREPSRRLARAADALLLWPILTAVGAALLA